VALPPRQVLIGWHDKARRIEIRAEPEMAARR